MKVFAISDLHLSFTAPKPMDIFGEKWTDYERIIKEDWESKVSPDDIVLLCGDLSWAMKLEDAIIDLNWIAEMKGKKVILRGNHDFWWKSISALRNILPQNMYAIQNDCLRLDSYLLCGTRGWTGVELNKTKDDETIYSREIQRLELSLLAMQKIRKPEDTVIGMMHYPPFDTQFNSSPFTDLFSKYDVKTVVYGHLHGARSRCKDRVTINNTEYILTSCDQIGNKLIELI